MRNALCEGLIRCAARPEFMFLTGDLGFGALEPLRAAIGPRFVNAGVAEQNMISLAAGLAYTGMRPWVYSIAPFVYARPYEQIRNDVCLHDLPVKLVGNGGGYGYGVMGATHHALEDYGALLCLPNMRVFVPAFASDLAPLLDKLADIGHPAYLRLGRCELPPDFALPAYAPWRNVIEGHGATLLVVGAGAGGFVAALGNLPINLRPDLWVVSELPLLADSLPPAFLDSLRRSRHLVVVEEHVAHGGVGQMLARALLQRQVPPLRFTHHHAQGYLSGRYGSQQFHRAEAGLDAKSVLEGLTT